MNARVGAFIDINRISDNILRSRHARLAVLDYVRANSFIRRSKIKLQMEVLCFSCLGFARTPAVSITGQWVRGLAVFMDVNTYEKEEFQVKFLHDQSSHQEPSAVNVCALGMQKAPIWRD